MAASFSVGASALRVPCSPTLVLSSWVKALPCAGVRAEPAFLMPHRIWRVFWTYTPVVQRVAAGEILSSYAA